jgi:hypothetical protein
MDACMAPLFGGSRFVLRVGSSKKLDPTFKHKSPKKIASNNVDLARSRPLDEKSCF